MSECRCCGRCTEADEPRDDEHEPVPCDNCERMMLPGDELVAFFGGRFCSDVCAAQYEHEFRTHTERVVSQE